MLPARRLEQLRALGLAEYPARAYLALLELGPSTASAVAARSGVPRGKVYATLNDLHARGLVEVTPERPHRYVAAPVAELLALLRRRHREALARIAEEEQSLVRGLGHARAEAPPPPGGVTVVRGRRNFLERLRATLAAADAEVVVATTGAGLARLAEEIEELETARDRGVVVRVRGPLDEAPRGVVDTLAAVADVEDGRAPAAEVTFVLVDGRTAILARAMPDDARLYRGDDLTVVVDDRRLAEGLRALLTDGRADGREEQEGRLELP